MTKPFVPISAAALAILTACATTAALPAGTVDVRAAMQHQIDPAVMSIWDVTNNAMDEEGGVDPAQMDDAKWAQVAAGAERLAASGREMASAASLIAAAPGNTAVEEGQVTMEQVQRLLDSDQRLYRLMSTAFADHAERLAAAARNRDAVATGDLVAGLDEVCAACHSRFWYAD